LLRIAESYRSDHLTGASLVFAAATPTVNACVVADAQERGLWVNSATNPSAGDFILPSVVRSGQFTLATSTAGTAPALARRVKEKLAAEFDRAFADWLEVLGEMRKQVLTTISDEVPRRQLLEDFADWPWLERVRAEGVAAVRLAMEAIVRATGNRKGDS
jgi:precorrin-2 dehydrogenase/sirohydrochlorin ferrochelatase